MQLLLALLMCVATFSTAAELGLRVRDMANAPGAEVTQVMAGSLAAQAGLQTGDIILQIERDAVTSGEHFAQRVKRVPEGTPFSIRISRDGWERELLLHPPAPEVSQPKKFGLRLTDPAAGQGAQIAAVILASSAARAGLKSGDLVTQVNGSKQAGAKNIASLMQEAAAHDRPLRLTVAREGWEKEVSVIATTIPAGVSTTEWKDVDQWNPGEAQQPTPTLPSAAGQGGSARAQQSEPPDLPRVRREMLSLDAAAYKAYVEERNLADERYQVGNWSEAERYYQRIIRLIPSDPNSWGRLCHAFIMQERYSEAVSACRRSLELGEPQPETLNNLALSYFKLGTMGEAKDAYLRAIELAPQWPPPYAGLGAVYSSQRDWPQVEKYYRLALERDPTNTGYKQTVERLPREQRNASEAAQQRVSRPAAPLGQESVQPSARAVQESQAIHTEAVPAGKKAMIAIGDFQVKAAGAGQFIGDGLREMLVTTMYNHGSYILVERMDIQGLAAEQALSRSRMARPDSVIPERQMDVAEIMVYAAVTEFEAEASGGGLELGIPKVPLNLGLQSKTAHLAIDVRVVDVASGRLLAAQRIDGKASSSQTTVGTILSRGGTSIPVSLGAFRNTPMEQAIRECVQKAVIYITSNTPRKYFRHE